MPERAEEDDLVVFQLLLFVDHRADAVELRVVFRQQICELQHMMSQCHQCGRSFSVQIVLIHVYIRVFNHLFKAPCDQIPDVGREPEDAACRLTSDRAHHEGNAAHIVELGKRFVFKSQQFVMQVVLLRGEAGFDRVRPADAEILNILSACPVQHGVEAMERFHVGNEFDAFFACNVRPCQSCQNVCVQWILCNDIFAPLCGSDILQLGNGNFLPSFARSAYRVGAPVNEFVGSGHHAEHVFVHDDVRA